jgi:hypothetical protein
LKFILLFAGVFTDSMISFRLDISFRVSSGTKIYLLSVSRSAQHMDTSKHTLVGYNKNKYIPLYGWCGWENLSKDFPTLEKYFDIQFEKCTRRYTCYV